MTFVILIKVAVSHWTWKKGCFGALEPAVPNYIAKFSLRVPNACVAQYDDWVVAKR